MSHAARDWAWTVRGLSQKAGYVLHALVRHADRQMLCSPGVELLAEMTFQTPRSVQKAMRELEDRGLITRFESSGTSNTYELHVSPAGVEAREEGVNQVQGSLGLPGFGRGEFGSSPPEPPSSPPEPGSPKQRLSLSQERDSLLEQTIPPLAAQRTLRLLAVQDVQKPPDAKTLLYSTGLATLRHLTRKSDERARNFLGSLLKQARNDHARVLRLIDKCRDVEPAHPTSWLKAAACRPDPSERRTASGDQRPARSDPPDRWMHLGDGREEDEQGIVHPVVGGCYLDVIAEEVCLAARIGDPNWRPDWGPLIGWLREGIDPHATILPVIRKRAAWSEYEPPGSLRYFDSAVRAKAAA